MHRTHEYTLVVTGGPEGEEVYTPEELTMLINDGLDLRVGVRVTSDDGNGGECPLTDSGAYNPPDVEYCPSCGGDVEETDTPTMYRCAESGETFYVEV